MKYPLFESTVMKRSIQGYRKDELDDWVAILDCGHGQHVRHQPPFINRPWTDTEAGRQEKIGALLNCKRCDNLEIPEDFVMYRRTNAFTEQKFPHALLKEHHVSQSTWAKIVIEEGGLRYVIPEMAVDMWLDRNQSGVVLPNVMHHIDVPKPVTFYIEFYCAAEDA